MALAGLALGADEIRRRTIRRSSRIGSLAGGLLVGLALGGAASAQDGNVLLIIADDVGVDVLGAYQPLEGSQSVPPTPTLDALAAEGILFRHVWSNPLCATSRVTIQTGRYGHRTGIRGAAGHLPSSEVSLPEAIQADPAADVSTAFFGKWGIALQDIGTHPVQTGYDFFTGRNICCIGEGYQPWTRYTAGFDTASSCDPEDPSWHQDPACIESTEGLEPIYETTKIVDEARDWINAVYGAEPGQRWFAVVSFSAAHSPYHEPPSHLHSYGPGLGCPGQAPTCFRAMVEAMDTEIQRLFDEIPPEVLAETTVVFLGDNGSPGEVTLPPFDPARGKGSLYEGGIGVPLIVAGAKVLGTPRVADDLVNTVDLFETLLDLLGVDSGLLPAQLATGEWRAHDSVSLAPILADDCAGGCTAESPREYAFAESVDGGKTVRDRAGYKLKVKKAGPTWELFQLPSSGVEDPGQNLLDPVTGELLVPDAQHQAALDQLEAALGLPNDPPNLPPVNADADQDGVPEDGDGSGFGRDAPCGTGQTLGCDDNCPDDPNPNQDDQSASGFGDVCEQACSNGLDDDGDTLIDYPADLGCENSASTNEAPECNDGVDNDNDGKIDQLDPHCASAYDDQEWAPKKKRCGLGFEVGLLLPLAWTLVRRRPRGSRRS